MSVYHTFNTVKFININVTVDCFCHLELVFLFCGSSECLYLSVYSVFFITVVLLNEMATNYPVMS